MRPAEVRRCGTDSTGLPGVTLSGQSASGIAIAGNRCLRRFLDLDLGAILQFVKAGERDDVARVEAFDGRDVAIGGLLDNVLDGGSVVAVTL